MLNISLNIQNLLLSNISSSALTNYYVNRVNEDGGKTESKKCLESDYSLYNWRYYFRVVSDSGTVESLECVNF